MTTLAPVTERDPAQSIIRFHAIAGATARGVQKTVRDATDGTTDGFTGRPPPARAGEGGITRSLFHVPERDRLASGS